MKIVQVGVSQRAYKEHSVVVYDRGSGRIVHVHHLLTLARKAPDPAALEGAALAHAATSGHQGPSLAAVHLEGEQPPRGGRYRIDPATRALVADGEAKKPRRKPRRGKAGAGTKTGKARK